MDGQEYLNQISAENRPTKNQKMQGILSSKIFLVIMIGIVALIAIMIVGSILGGGGGGDKNNNIKLLLHLNSTAELVKEYQPNIKSSSLRASSASLDSVLNVTSKSVDDYLVEKYNYKEKNADKKIVEQIESEKESLAAELFEAKINGVLDRIFAHKMTYEITVFMAEEEKVLSATKNDALKEALTASYDSLKNLYNEFNDFSETK